eukprot:SAG31_NODE_15777_length_739_cov_1.134375_1_plen_64_part_10
MRVPIPTVEQLAAIETAAASAEAARALKTVVDELVAQMMLDATTDATATVSSPAKAAADRLALQ